VPYLAYDPLPSLAPTSETPVSLTCLEAGNGLLPESAAAISQGSDIMALIKKAPASDAAIFRTKRQHQDRVTGRAATRQRASRVRCLQKKLDAGMVADCNVPSYHLIRVIGKLSTVPCLSGIISNQSLYARSRAFVMLRCSKKTASKLMP
jgi:hypothetical protein